MTTFKQPTAAPTRKLQSALLGGALASVGMGVIAIFYPEAYARVPAGFEGGVATLFGFVLGYIVKERVS